MNRWRPQWPSRCAQGRDRSPNESTRRPSGSMLFGGKQIPRFRRAMDHLPRPVHVVADHRFAGDQSLGQGPRQPLAQADVHQNVHRTDQFRNPLGRHQSGELKIGPPAPLAESGLSNSPRSTPSPTSRNRASGHDPNHTRTRRRSGTRAPSGETGGRSCRSPRAGPSNRVRPARAGGARRRPGTARRPCRCRPS